MLLLRVDMESLGHRTIQHKFCCQLMLPIRKTRASLLIDWSVCVKDLRLSFKKTLSRAPRVDAKLISCNPSLQDKKTNYYTAYEGLGWEQFYNRRAIRSSPMYGEDYLTFIYYKEMLSGLSTLRKPVTV